MKTTIIGAVSMLLAASAFGAEKDRRAILGTWRGQMPNDAAGSIELTITPTRISGRNPRTGKSLGEGPYVLDPANGTLDSSRLIGKSTRGKRYLGILRHLRPDAEVVRHEPPNPALGVGSSARAR